MWVIGAVAVLSLVLSIGNMVGDNQPGVQLGTTRFPSGLNISNGLTVSTGDLDVSVGSIHASSAATTTLSLTSTAATRGGCIQMETTNGSTTRIFLAGTTTALTIAEGTCQ